MRLFLSFAICAAAVAQPPAAIPTGLSGPNYQSAVNAWMQYLNTNKTTAAGAKSALSAAPPIEYNSNTGVISCSTCSASTTAGVAFVSSALGNGVTDATSAIQAALDTSTIGTVVIPQGNYLFSGITIPEGKELVCVGSGTPNANALIPGTHTAVSKLTYTGSGIAIASAWSTDGGKMNVRNCNITKSGSLAGIGIQLDTSIGSRIEGNLIKNFSTCVKLNGASAGNYYDEVTHNALECTIGVEATSSGAAQVNSTTVSDNRINFANIGIKVCTGCRGWKIQRNNIECPSGSGGFGIYATGDGHTLDTNWIEPNSCNTATTFTAIYARGPNLVLNNYLAQSESGDWTNLSFNIYTTVINPNISGNISGAPPFYFPRIQINPVIVSDLPTCAAGTASTYWTVTDSLTPVQGAAVAGSGAVTSSVFCNGTNWVVTSGSPAGVSASGSACAITAIVKGVITAASCTP